MKQILFYFYLKKIQINLFESDYLQFHKLPTKTII